jgi:hypothetical protein
MQSKLLVTAVGAFGFGALVGWAVTADIAENRLFRERKEYDKSFKEKTEHIWALQDRLDNSGNQSSGIVRIDIDPNQQELIGLNDWNTHQPAKAMQLEIDESKVLVYTPEDVELKQEPEETKQETAEEKRTNLEKLIEAYTANQDAQDEFVEMASKSIDDENTPPYIISRDAYAWDDEGENYGKNTLTYFPRDRVLLDEDEDPIEDIANTIGWRNLTQFGSESEDPNVVFIRNRRLEADFEVVKEDEGQLPLHVKYGMEKDEFYANKAAGLIKLRQEDDDN